VESEKIYQPDLLRNHFVTTEVLLALKTLAPCLYVFTYDTGPGHSSSPQLHFTQGSSENVCYMGKTVPQGKETQIHQKSMASPYIHKDLSLSCLHVVLKRKVMGLLRQF